MIQYKHAFLGGTFDRLHLGHKYFIDVAVNQSEHIFLGLTSDSFLGRRVYRNLIEPYTVRERKLKEYLKSQNYLNKTTITRLQDIYGPSILPETSGALFAINESFANARLINKKRKTVGLPELKVIIVPMVKSDDGGFISSKRIRAGEIDREGHSYLKLFNKHQKLILPEDLKEELRKKFGKILKNNDDYKNLNSAFVITVGDITTANMIKNAKIPNVSIFDFKTNRKKITDQNILKLLPKPNAMVQNAPGTIEKGAADIVYSKIHESLKSKNKYAIQVEGEEDLLALPSILFSPLNSMVVYGLHDIGAIAVRVGEDIKADIKEITAKFNKP